MKTLSVVLYLCVAAGCAARTSSSGSSAARPDRDLISRQELADPALRSLTVLEVVRSLRPTYLSSRGKLSLQDSEAGKVHASIDGIGVVALEELKNVLVTGVIEIRFLNAGAAMQRFGGSAHQGPVILVRTM